MTLSKICGGLGGMRETCLSEEVGDYCLASGQAHFPIFPQGTLFEALKRKPSW